MHTHTKKACTLNDNSNIILKSPNDNDLSCPQTVKLNIYLYNEITDNNENKWTMSMLNNMVESHKYWFLKHRDKRIHAHRSTYIKFKNRQI